MRITIRSVPGWWKAPGLLALAAGVLLVSPVLGLVWACTALAALVAIGVSWAGGMREGAEQAAWAARWATSPGLKPPDAVEVDLSPDFPTPNVSAVYGAPADRQPEPNPFLGPPSRRDP